jgi:hypothetical protein
MTPLACWLWDFYLFFVILLTSHFYQSVIGFAFGIRFVLYRTLPESEKREEKGSGWKYRNGSWTNLETLEPQITVLVHDNSGGT